MGRNDFGRQWQRYAEQQMGQHRSGWGGEWHGDWSGRGPSSRRGKGGPPPWVAGLFGLAQGAQSRGPRVRRGDVRAAILDVLSGGSRNGYQLIAEISERTHGAWKPSPGSVYPTLSVLEDEGLIEADEQSGRRAMRLTEEGRTYVADNPYELAAVWVPFEGEESVDGNEYASLKPEIGQVMNAAWQIISTGTDQQRRDAIKVLIETRRSLYGILAEGDEAEVEPDPGEGDGWSGRVDNVGEEPGR